MLQPLSYQILTRSGEYPDKLSGSYLVIKQAAERIQNIRLHDPASFFISIEEKSGSCKRSTGFSTKDLTTALFHTKMYAEIFHPVPQWQGTEGKHSNHRVLQLHAKRGEVIYEKIL